GHLSTAAIASELNARGVRACRGNCWTMRRVRDTLRRMRNCKIDYTPDGVAQATALAKVRNPKRSKAAHIPKSTSFRLPQRQSPKSKSRQRAGVLFECKKCPACVGLRIAWSARVLK